MMTIEEVKAIAKDFQVSHGAACRILKWYLKAGEPGVSLDDLVSVKRAAHILGIGEATAYRRIKSGKLPTVDADGVMKVRVSDIMDILRKEAEDNG